MNVYYQLNLLKDMNSTKNSSKKDIRQMLHPALEDDNLPKTTQNLVGTKAHIQNMFLTNKTRIKISPKFYSRHQEFAKLPKTNLDVPVIRNASPYVSEEELYRKEYIQSKKNWVGQKSFKNYFGKASSSTSSNFIPNYVTITPSEPPILHKFRDLEREKWVDENFKY